MNTKMIIIAIVALVGIGGGTFLIVNRSSEVPVSMPEEFEKAPQPPINEVTRYEHCVISRLKAASPVDRAADTCVSRRIAGVGYEIDEIIAGNMSAREKCMQLMLRSTNIPTAEYICSDQ
jgi:hypothetical protein